MDMFPPGKFLGDAVVIVLFTRRTWDLSRTKSVPAPSVLNVVA